jgi:hypothetical protein
MTTALNHLRNLKKGDQISLVLAGIIVDGTFEELVDDCVVLLNAKSSAIKKKNYTLKIPVDNIYAWGEKQKKDQKKEQKKEQKKDKKKEKKQEVSE